MDRKIDPDAADQKEKAPRNGRPGENRGFLSLEDRCMWGMGRRLCGGRGDVFRDCREAGNRRNHPCPEKPSAWFGELPGEFPWN